MSLSFPRELLSIRPKSPNNVYQYSQLNSSLQEIRLLRLLPPDGVPRSARRLSTSTPKLRCQIVSVPLDPSPGFAALSYAWGSSKQNKEIEVDGSSMYISEKLQDALLQFQADDKARWNFLWIDAVCSCSLP